MGSCFSRISRRPYQQEKHNSSFCSIYWAEYDRCVFSSSLLEYKREEESLLLTTLDYYSIGRIISLLDGCSLLNLLLTCKRLNKIGSIPNNWGQEVQNLRIAYIFKELIEVSSIYEFREKFQPLLTEFKKTRSVLQIFNKNSLSLLSTSYGPIVLPLMQKSNLSLLRRE